MQWWEQCKTEPQWSEQKSQVGAGMLNSSDRMNGMSVIKGSIAVNQYGILSLTSMCTEVLKQILRKAIK